MRNPDPACPACGRLLPSAPQFLATLTACPNCLADLEIAVFPAFGRGPMVGRTAEKTSGDDEATCFFHPSKKASVPCDRCGRFLCALCDLPFGSEHLCPTCVQAAQKSGGIEGVVRARVRWDIIVWWTVLLPVLVCYFVLPITGLVAAGLAIWGLRRPPSRVARSRFSLIAGMITGLLFAGGGIAAYVALLMNK